MSAIDVFAGARPEVPELTPEHKSALAHELFGAYAVERVADVHSVDVGRPLATATRRRWFAVWAAAAAVIALVVGLVVVASDREAEAPAAPPTQLPAQPVEPLRLLPADPSSYEFDGEFRERWLDPVGDYIVLARPDGDGGFFDPIRVSRISSEASVVLNTRGLSDFEAAGRPMQFLDDVATGNRLVQFDVGDGTTVMLVTVRQGPAGTSRDELASIGLSLDLTVDGLVMETPPEGFQTVASGRYTAATTRSLSVRPGGYPFVDLFITVASDPGFPFLVMPDRMEPVTVRGLSGWVGTSILRTDAGSWERSVLIWEERPGQWAEVWEAEPLALDELSAFADSLVEVDADQYASIVDEEISPTVPSSLETVPTTAPANELVADGPATTLAPQTAPPGSVLMTSIIVGLGHVYGRQLERLGAEVLEPALIPAGGTGLIEQSRVYARDDAGALGLWVAGELGIGMVDSFDIAADAAIEADVSAADVVVVLGRDLALRDGRAIVPFIVGDSLVEISALERRGYLNVGLTTGSLPDEVAFAVAQFSVGVLVVQVATDEPLSREVLDSALAAASGIPSVILVNVDANVPWKQPTNALLAEVDRPDDNIFLLDWDALAEQCPGECFAADGIHLTEVGAEYFAYCLGEITGY